MYSLKDKQIISEFACGKNFEYIIENSAYFMSTGYKVLQTQNSNALIKCMKMTKNGKIDLFYLTEDYRSVNAIASTLNTEAFISVMVNLFSSILEVKSIGFLDCEHIDISWDKIFVEPHTLQVKLVYLPINVKTYESFSEFDSELRSGIVRFINSISVKVTDRLEQFIRDLCNGSLTLENVYNRNKVAGGRNTAAGRTTMMASAAEINSLVNSTGANNRGLQTADPPRYSGNRTPVSAPAPVAQMGRTIKLIATNLPSYYEIVVDSGLISIGRNGEVADKVVPNHKSIGRKHCEIVNVNGAFFIRDCRSMNGTFVNGVRINPDVNVPIKVGDTVRLADVEFLIV